MSELTTTQVRALRILGETPLVAFSDGEGIWLERGDNEKRTRINFSNLSLLCRAKLVESYDKPFWRWRITEAGRAELARRDA